MSSGCPSTASPPWFTQWPPRCGGHWGVGNDSAPRVLAAAVWILLLRLRRQAQQRQPDVGFYFRSNAYLF